MFQVNIWIKKHIKKITFLSTNGSPKNKINHALEDLSRIKRSVYIYAKERHSIISSTVSNFLVLRCG